MSVLCIIYCRFLQGIVDTLRHFVKEVLNAARVSLSVYAVHDVAYAPGLRVCVPHVCFLDCIRVPRKIVSAGIKPGLRAGRLEFCSRRGHKFLFLPPRSYDSEARSVPCTVGSVLLDNGQGHFYL